VKHRLTPYLPSLALVMLGACSSIPGLDDPTLTLAPYYAGYEVRGSTNMQSDAGMGVLMNNGEIDLEQFGVNSRDDDVGIYAEMSEGISGLRFTYLRLDQVSQDKGILPANWGNMLETDLVRTVLEMDEYRLNYTAAIFDQTVEFRDEDLRMELGIGGTIAHRDFVMRVREESAILREEKIELKDDGVLYGTARARLSWRGAAITADYAYSDDWSLGGDFKGVLQDLEITGSYELDFQDVRLFGGWRRTEIPAQGTRDEFRVATDFLIEGFYLGLGIDF